MIEISKLNLSVDLINKLKDKSIESLSIKEEKIFNAVKNGSNVVFDYEFFGFSSFIAPIIHKLESVKIGTIRKSKVIILVDNNKLCDTMSEEIRSLITKDLLVCSIHSDISLTKCRKRLQQTSDVIVGTTDKIKQLYDSGFLTLRHIKHIVILSFDKMNIEELGRILTDAIKIGVNKNVRKSNERNAIQLVIATSKLNELTKSFLLKHVNGIYDYIDDQISVKESSNHVSESSGDENSKCNGSDTPLLDRQKPEENAIDKSSSIQKQGSLTISKLSGQEGFTTYIFKSNQEITGNGYLFKLLKKFVDDDLIEKIQRIQPTKDSHGFVFDLPSSLNESFRSSWVDSESESLQILQGDIPDLVDSRDNDNVQGNTNGRGRDLKNNKRPGSSNEAGDVKIVKLD